MKKFGYPKLQSPTFQNRFTTAMRNSFRKFLSLPKSTPRRIMEKLFEEGKIKQFRSVNNKLIQRFLGQEPIDQEEKSRVEDYVRIAELLPINFNQLFIYAGKKCICHNKHLTWDQILIHSNIQDHKFKIFFNSNINIFYFCQYF